MRVSLAKSGRSFRAADGKSLLDSALAAGIKVPHACKHGNCGACRTLLLRGEVRYPEGPPLGLSVDEVKEGVVLLCQARACGDLLIDHVETCTPDEVIVKRLPARLDRMERLSHDVVSVYLRLPAAEYFAFEPGQYIDIMLGAGRRRSFSIASPPHDARLLELHIRRVEGGEFTERLFGGGDVRNWLLSIEGPFGACTYRNQSSAPLLLVGGGTGLAPLFSMLRHVIDNRLPREMLLYWGVRSEADLYAQHQIESLALRSVASFGKLTLRYVPVLSAAGPDWTGRRGMVHEAVLEDGLALGAMDIHAAGPPAMIEALSRDFVARGADPARLRVEAFDYAPDALERHCLMADNKC